MRLRFCDHRSARTYQNALEGQNDRRWRVEHAQIVSDGFDYFSNNILPVQPTHATKDMYWAEDRIGKHRMKDAYAYNSLLKHTGIIAPALISVEHVNPFIHFCSCGQKRFDIQT